MSWITVQVIHHYQRVAEQLAQTEELLNKYINILSKSEQISKLLFDEQWLGAQAVSCFIYCAL